MNIEKLRKFADYRNKKQRELEELLVFRYRIKLLMGRENIERWKGR